MDAQPNPEGIQAFVTNSDLKAFIHSDPTFGEYYINLNTAQPPFDDLHVRRAVNWVVDKAGLLRLFGGPIKGTIATHTIPNTMLPNEKSYDPYATPNEAGSVAKAKQEMMQSKYDTNHDGTCDAAECKNVVMVIDGADPNPKLAAVIQRVGSIVETPSIWISLLLSWPPLILSCILLLSGVVPDVVQPGTS